MINNLCCPNCHNDLTFTNENELICKQCQAVFPLILGIPDLRWPQESHSNSPDPLSEKLLYIYDQVNFAGLVSAFSDYSALSPELVSMYAGYRLDVDRGTRFYRMFREKWQLEYDVLLQADMALDIGCGTGKGLIPLANDFDQVIGIEPDLASLILAKKLLEEHNIKNVILLQAYAQSLPIKRDTITWCHAQNVLDHLFDAPPAFQEICRVLRRECAFCADSHNRYDVFSKEPHVKIRGVGWLPRSWMKPYVKFRTGENYKDIHLLSIFEVRDALEKSFGLQSAKICFPDVVPYGYPATWNRFVNGISKVPLLNFIVLSVFPSQLVLAKK